MGLGGHFQIFSWQLMFASFGSNCDSYVEGHRDLLVTLARWCHAPSFCRVPLTGLKASVCLWDHGCPTWGGGKGEGKSGWGEGGRVESESVWRERERAT